jgi:oligopeptide transport system ATP-binding protein
METPLLEILNVKKHYPLTSGLLDRFSVKVKTVKALNGINLTIYRGETLGLVGESGCGKTTLGRIILNLEKPTEGFVQFEGEKISKFKRRSDIKRFRKKMQMVFQNPSSTLDPRMTVRQILAEPLKIHYQLTKKELDNEIIALLEMVGLNAADAHKYSGEFSDGQKQRIALVRALSVKPDFVVADEPVSALDVSVQAQILNLMKQIQNEMHLTMLFISHDLHVVRFLAGRIAVIYLGKIVEIGETEELYESHYHPYSEELFSSILDPNPETTLDKSRTKSEVPVSQIDIPSGCVFRLRCTGAQEQCSAVSPELREVSRNHFVACFLKQ